MTPDEAMRDLRDILEETGETGDDMMTDEMLLHSAKCVIVAVDDLTRRVGELERSLRKLKTELLR